MTNINWPFFPFLFSTCTLMFKITHRSLRLKSFFSVFYFLSFISNTTSIALFSRLLIFSSTESNLPLSSSKEFSLLCIMSFSSACSFDYFPEFEFFCFLGFIFLLHIFDDIYNSSFKVLVFYLHHFCHLGAWFYSLISLYL